MKVPRICLALYLFLMYTFIFQVQSAFSIILYWFQVCGMVVRHSYTLHSVSPALSSTHLAPYPVITVFLTVVPVLAFAPLGLLCNHQSVLLHPFALFARPSSPLATISSLYL